MNYREWECTVPAEIKGDSVWKSEAYRLALFAADLGWHAATKLLTDKRTISVADQLYRSVGAVSADVEEGYSRGTGRDRARFYEYGLGSAREARGWCFKGRHVLGAEVTGHRLQLHTQIVKPLLTMIPNQRGAGSARGFSTLSSGSGTTRPRDHHQSRRTAGRRPHAMSPANHFTNHVPRFTPAPHDPPHPSNQD